MKICRPHAMRGFSLLEMSMVLVIIGVVMGAVMVGTDVLRQAKGQQAFAVFVSGWRDAFSQYVQVTGGVPGDTSPPSNIINSALAISPPPPICGNALSNSMLGSGVRIPQGRGLRQETTYLYQDSNGSPRVLTVCFQTLVARPGGGAGLADEGWAVLQALTPTGATFVNVNRHVMVITGLTTELAMQMDVLIDGAVNPRQGQFRMRQLSNALDEVNPGWGDVKTDMGHPESAQNEVTAHFEMF